MVTRHGLFATDPKTGEMRATKTPNSLQELAEDIAELFNGLGRTAEPVPVPVPVPVNNGQGNAL